MRCDENGMCLLLFSLFCHFSTVIIALIIPLACLIPCVFVCVCLIVILLTKSRQTPLPSSLSLSLLHAH